MVGLLGGTLRAEGRSKLDTGNTLESLAAAMGVPADAFVKTVER